MESIKINGSISTKLVQLFHDGGPYPYRQDETQKQQKRIPKIKSKFEIYKFKTYIKKLA